MSYVKNEGFRSLNDASKDLGFSKQILRDEIQRLFVIGFLESDSLQGGIYRVSDSGNAMLDVCSRLRDYLQGNLGENNENKEFEHICSSLGIDYPSVPAGTITLTTRVDIQSPTALLMQHVGQAETDGSVVWPEPYFAMPSM